MMEIKTSYKIFQEAHMDDSKEFDLKKWIAVDDICKHLRDTKFRCPDCKAEDKPKCVEVIPLLNKLSQS